MKVVFTAYTLHKDWHYVFKMITEIFNNATYEEGITESNNEDPLFVFTRRDEMIQTVFFSTSSFGIPGNVLTLLAILTSPKMRVKPFNLLLVIQSFNDACACLVTCLLQSFTPTFGGKWGFLVCYLWATRYLFWAFTITSGYNLAVIAIERYLAISKPLQYDADKARRRMPLIAFIVFAFGFSFVLPEVFLAKHVDDKTCISYYQLTLLEVTLLGVFYAIGSPVIPMIIMAYCYTCIAKCLHDSSKQFSNKNEKIRNAEIRLIQVTGIVTLFYSLSYTYLFIVNFGVLFFNFTHYPQYQISVCLIIVNACINPYIYCIRYDEFQNRIIEIFNGICLCLNFRKTTKAIGQ